MPPDAEMRVEAGNYVIRQGEGKNKIRIRTENGAIKIGSDGYMNLNFIRQKLEELKDSILKSKTLEDKIKAQKIVATVVDALNKAADRITEARIKDSLISAADKLKELVEGFDVQEAKDKVVSGVEKVGDEISNSLRELFMKLKFAKDHGYKFKNLNIKRKVEEAMDYSGPGNLKEFIKNGGFYPRQSPKLGSERKEKAGSGRPQPHEDTGDAGKRQDFRGGGGTPLKAIEKE